MWGLKETEWFVTVRSPLILGNKNRIWVIKSILLSLPLCSLVSFNSLQATGRGLNTGPSYQRSQCDRSVLTSVSVPCAEALRTSRNSEWWQWWAEISRRVPTCETQRFLSAARGSRKSPAHGLLGEHLALYCRGRPSLHPLSNKAFLSFLNENQVLFYWREQHWLGGPFLGSRPDNMIIISYHSIAYNVPSSSVFKSSSPLISGNIWGNLFGFWVLI